MLEVHVDARVGGLPRYYFGEKAPTMMVPDAIRKCVAFIDYRWTDGTRHCGTAFFVRHEVPNTRADVTYVVTAKHVIAGVGKYSMDEIVRLRVNSTSGGTIEIESKCSDWLNHSADNSIDVAVLPCALLREFDQLQFPVEGFAPRDWREIGVGDDIFATGLFTSHAGTTRNIPIVRVGNIAAMPEERVRSRFGNSDLRAYLIEARSIGGLSGSPVFVMHNRMQRRNTKDIIVDLNQPSFHLLGLIHGHFDMPKDGSGGDSVVEDDAKDGSIHSGIGVVVPADDIVSVLHHPALVAQRQKIQDDWRASHRATPDSA